MFGIFLLIAAFIALGFLLAWIVGIVAREEISITTGVVILFLSGLLSIAVGEGLNWVAPHAAYLVQPFANFAILMLLIHLLAHLTLKHSAIIAAIYAAIILAIVVAFSI